MFFNPDKPILNLDGTTVMSTPDKIMTHGEVSCAALLAPNPVDPRTGIPEQMSPDEQIKRAKLAYSIHGSTEPVEIDVDDASLIKKLVARRGWPLITFQISEALNNQEFKNK